jgi:hypothetical protein
MVIDFSASFHIIFHTKYYEYVSQIWTKDGTIELEPQNRCRAAESNTGLTTVSAAVEAQQPLPHNKRARLCGTNDLFDNTLHARQSPYFHRMIESLIRLYDASDERTGSGNFGDGIYAIASLQNGLDNKTG